MGSPSYCYRQYLKEYVRLNIVWSKYEKVYNEDFIIEKLSGVLANYLSNGEI